MNASSNLKRAQEIMLDILIEFDQICETHSIPYWLDGGTLLGAIRHGGFIPWDDDIDVMVPREYIDKLRRVLNSELPNDYFIQFWRSDEGIIIEKLKIRHRKSRILENKYELNSNYHQGIFIDIFSADFIGDKKEISFERIKARLLLLCVESILIPQKVLKSRLKVTSSMFVKVLRIMMYALTLPFKVIFTKSTLCSKFEKYILVRATKIRGEKYVSYGIELPWKNSYPYNVVFPLGKVVFENRVFSCPGNSHAYLKSFYGNYMELPPEDKRIFHSYDIRLDLDVEELKRQEDFINTKWNDN